MPTRVVVALCCLLACVAPPAEAGRSAIVVTVAVAGGACGDPLLGGTCLPWFPDVVRDPHGDADDLLMVYRWSAAHTKAPAQLRLVRSRDGGASWTPAVPFVVGAGDVDYRDPSLVVLRSGRLLLSYFVAESGSGAVVGTRVNHRDGDDVAFSAPASVRSSTLPTPATSAKIVELADGVLLVPLYGSPPGGLNQAVVVSSVDGGLTWDGTLPGRQKTIAAAAGVSYQEPALAEVVPGQVRAVVRVADGPAVQTDSYGGTYLTTWGQPWSLGVPMHGPELLPVPGTDYLPYVWSQPTTNTSRPTWIALRRGAVGWPQTPRHVLHDGAATSDTGYPSTVALDATRLVTAVYDVAREALLVLRYPVADVT